MLLVFDALKQLHFSALMAVYEDGNRENGAQLYPDLPAGQQMLRAEQDFYAYLQTGFFTQPGDLYCIWQEDGQYVAALRLQRYGDGLLLEALETHPAYRRRGYAEALIRAVLDWTRPEKLYSHISHRNMPSIAVHQKCGFRKIASHARYADGSVNSRCGTYLYEKQETQA